VNLVFFINEEEVSRTGELRGDQVSDTISGVTVGLEKFKDNYDEITTALSGLFASNTEAHPAFEVGEIDVELGISATGKVGLWGNGIEATGLAKVNVKFVRRS